MCMDSPGSGRFGVRNLSGVYVEEIRVETPPFDKMGTIQERVGRGATSDENFFPAEEFDPDMVQDTVEELGDMIGNPERYRVVYNLIIRAPKGLPEAAVKRIVMPKARIFTRRNNPFSPDIFAVQFMGEADLDFDTADAPGFDEYRVISKVKNF